MSYKGREIESKLIVQSKSLARISSLLENTFDAEIANRTIGISTDRFWKAPEESTADFVRLRGMDVVSQVTVKGRDREDNLNRMEIEFLSHSNPKDLAALFTALLGKSLGSLSKEYHVFFLENAHTTVSVYTVQVEPEFEQVIVEVEARTMERMLELEKKVLDALKEKEIEVARAPGSLYQMFITREAK
jgi:hypothetical protein